MSNDKQTAVDSIIEFCHKQMDNDSSIHKGVYLSIIKFCKELPTEESEIHWKSTLVTTKLIEMSNNKQSSVEQFAIALYEKGLLLGDGDLIQTILDLHKAMHKEEITQAWKKGDGEFDNCAKEMSLEYYNDTFSDESNN